MIDGVKHYSFATTTCFGAASSADVFHDLGSAAEFILRCATAMSSSSGTPTIFSCSSHHSTHHLRARRPWPHATASSTCDALGLPIAKFEGPALL